MVVEAKRKLQDFVTIEWQSHGSTKNVAVPRDEEFRGVQIAMKHADKQTSIKVVPSEEWWRQSS